MRLRDKAKRRAFPQHGEGKAANKEVVSNESHVDARLREEEIT
jgi:hypothetical protein